MRIGNSLALLPTLADASCELVMAIDILEHVDTEEGLTLLDAWRGARRWSARRGSFTRGR